MKRFPYIFLCLILLAGPAHAQTELAHVFSGTVRDAESGRPLPYVTVSIPGQHYTTVTNSDGAFTIKSDRRPEALSFSHIGYKTQVEKIADAGAPAPLRVRMQPSVITLQEAIIIGNDPVGILNAAIAKIPQNFSDVPEAFDCFYRETVQKRQRYIYVAEAVTAMYKTEYSGSIRKDRTSVVKSRLLLSPRQRDTMSVKVIGGPAQAVMLDVVKDRDLLLNPDELSLYRIDMEPPVRIGDRLQYVIRITPYATVDYALQNGLFYIDEETLAFTRIELSLDMRDEIKATRMMLVSKPFGLRFRPRELSLLINYRYEEGKMRISYVRTQFRFHCDWKRRLFATAFTAVNEVAVTHHQTADTQPIPRQAMFRTSESLYDKAGLFPDPEFWKDYNIIEPSESLEHAIHKLKKSSE